MGNVMEKNREINIEGVVVQPLMQFADERGKVMHMLRSDSPLFENFGEIYFSTIKCGAVKAWKKHYRMIQLFAVPVGNIRLVIYDDRDKSGTMGNIKVVELGEYSYALVRIPPLLWYGFKGVSECDALVVNCASIPHDPSEQITVKYSDNCFPYRW